MNPTSPSSGRHNYAAPNTPIASSKQSAKKPSRIVSSPTATTAASAIASPIARKDTGLAAVGRTIAEEPNIPRRSSVVDPMHMATPSKNLFSPNLRYNEGTADASGNANVQTEIVEESANVESTAVELPAVDSVSVSDTETAVENSANTQVDTSNSEQEDDEDDDVFNPYLFIGNLPPHASVSIPNKLCLPASKKPSQFTLALDLDETLVHCSIEPIDKPDHIFPVSFNDVVYQVYVRKRPFLNEFLEKVSKKFEVVVFTASQKVYADTLLDLIDPHKKLVHYRLFREACLYVQGNYLKDLVVLNRDLKLTMLVDNSPHAYAYQVDNGIPIESWFDDPKDTELLKLGDFLEKFNDNVKDVRPIIHNHFKTYMLVQQAKLGAPLVTTSPPF